LDIRQIFFKYRSYTPVPFLLFALYFATPIPKSFLWGILLMIMGELIRIWGVSYAGGATRTRNVGANRLVTNGPFGFVRNPLYIGNMLMYSGAAIVANFWLPWLLLVVWLFFGMQYYFIIKLEEEKLQEIFGNEYLEYCREVPRIIPRLHPLRSSHPVQPNIKGALRSEKSTFLSFTLILLLFGIKMVFFLNK